MASGSKLCPLAWSKTLSKRTLPADWLDCHPFTSAPDAACLVGPCLNPLATEHVVALAAPLVALLAGKSFKKRAYDFFGHTIFLFSAIHDAFFPVDCLGFWGTNDAQDDTHRF